MDKQQADISDPLIAAAVEKYNSRRRQKGLLGGGAVFLIVFILVTVIAFITKEMVFFSFLLVGAAFSIPSYFYLNRHGDSEQEAVVAAVLKSSLGNETVYRRDSGFLASECRKVGLFQVGEIYKTSDYIASEYKGVSYSCANVSSGSITYVGFGRSRRPVYVHYFDGILLKYDFNKSIEGRIEIRENKSGVDETLYFRNKHKVELEDIDFNSMYTVYASDDHLAFYVLTPPLIEALKKIKRTIVGGLIFAFANDTLYIAVMGSGNKFELDKKITRETIEKIRKEVDPLPWFVDWFKLDSLNFKRNKGE